MPERWSKKAVDDFLKEASKTHEIKIVKYDGSIGGYSVEQAKDSGFETLVLVSKWLQLNLKTIKQLN